MDVPGSALALACLTDDLVQRVRKRRDALRHPFSLKRVFNKGEASQLLCTVYMTASSAKDEPLFPLGMNCHEGSSYSVFQFPKTSTNQYKTFDPWEDIRRYG